MTDVEKSDTSDVEVNDLDNSVEVALNEKAIKKQSKKPTRRVIDDETRQKRIEYLQKANEKRERERYLKLKEKYDNGEKAEVKETKEDKQELVKTTHTNSKGKKKVKKIVYEEDSDSSSEEEIVVKRKPKYRFNDDDIKTIREMEIERRLKLREEQDNIAKLENEALKRRYKEQLEQARKEQFAKFMFPESNFRKK